MKKYEATVMVEYKFTFESDTPYHKKLIEEAELIWDNLTAMSLDDEKYQDEEITVREIKVYSKVNSNA
jgi:hypothetical protein